MNFRQNLKRLTVTAIMAAAACILSPLSIPLPISLVPISARTLVFYLFSYLLRARDCVVACLVYMLLGIAGLPVFSGFHSGIAVFAGPTGGYLVGYLLVCLICPLVIHRYPNRRLFHIGGMVVATILMYALGSIWYLLYAKVSLGAVLAAAVLPFLPGDAAKIILAVLLGPILRRAILKSES